ncbi:MAG: transposase [Thermoplasmata archaeon]
MSFIRYKKINGKEYAYEVTAYWDSKDKKPKQVNRYLGVVVDKNKGIYKKKVPEEKMILDFGDTFFLLEYMKSRMPDEYEFMKQFKGLIPLVLYKIVHSGAMNNARIWAEGNYVSLVYNEDLSSQRISEYLQKIGNEKNLREFFSLHPSASAMMMDTTALPNQINIPITEWGYENEIIDEEIKLILVLDRKSMRPIFFRYVSGSIIDVSTLINTIRELKNSGIECDLLILDAGYYSLENLRDFYFMGIDFLMRLPAKTELYKEMIEIKDLEKKENAVIYGERVLFIKREKRKIDENDLYVYVILDPERRGREIKRYLKKHLNEADDFSLKRKGYMVLISSYDIAKEDLIPLYYTRQMIEKAFSYSKTDLSLIPLRVHGEATLRGYFFVVFLALDVLISLHSELKDRPVNEVLDLLRNLKCKVYDKEIVVQGLTKDQKEIFERFNIIMPKTMGI